VVIISAAIVYGGIIVGKGAVLPATLSGWASISAVALISTVLAIMAFLAGLERVGPTNAATLSTIEPAVTVVLSSVVLDETMTLLRILGGLMIIFAGIILARRELQVQKVASERMPKKINRSGDKKMRETIIIAHRGASGLAKENTLESFEKAIGLGVDMIEFDVRRTKDHVLIVYHDELMEGKRMEELTYKEICAIAGAKGFSVPTFEEVLKCTTGKVKLDVELKEEGYEGEVVEVLSKYFEKEQFVITSFYDFCIKRIKDNHPEIKAGLILGISKSKNFVLTKLSEFFPSRRCREAKADFLVAHWRLLWFGFLSRARRDHKPVFVWTVNEQKKIRKMLRDPRIDGIITDRPDLALPLREKMESGRIHQEVPGQ
jgi:glycerophosphoryl diester phosphodiesterase